MRKIILFVLLCVCMGISAQNLNWRAFDTNGPMGECLFPQNDNGEIIISDIVLCDMSADSIMGLAKEFMYNINKQLNANCKIELEGTTKIACRVKLPIGNEFFPIGSLVTLERSHSEVAFDLAIEVRKGKYKYTLSNFFTERRRIPGEGKNDGQSNMIHWQRVNSLTKEMPSKGKKREEYEKMIEDEKITYQAEYKAVQMVIEKLKTFTVISEDF